MGGAVLEETCRILTMCLAIPVRDCLLPVSRGRESMWSVGGNGEKMAEVQKAIDTEDVKKRSIGKAKKSSRATAKGTGAATKRKSAARKPKSSDGGAAVKDGAEQLRRAVDRRVGRNSERLAEVLTNKALEGDLAFAKAVVALADAKKPDPVKKRRGPSWAERLTAEPQWEGEKEE
jgi:hypothetical protein